MNRDNRDWHHKLIDSKIATPGTTKSEAVLLVMGIIMMLAVMIPLGIGLLIAATSSL